MRCWMNGSFCHEDELRVSPVSHGAFYGVNYLEVLRTYNGKVVFLRDYYTQLCEQLKLYRMAMPYSIQELEGVIGQLNEQDGQGGCFYLHVSAMEKRLFTQIYEYPDVQVIILRKPLAFFEAASEKQAIWLATPYKSESPSSRIQAGFEILDISRVEGFFVTEQGIVAEGMTSTIFWAKDGILYTPSVEVGVRVSVMRQIIMRLAAKMDYRVQQGIYLKAELEEAHECFIVNALEELVPITQLGKVMFAGREGLIYERLHHAYAYEISKELRRG